MALPLPSARPGTWGGSPDKRRGHRARAPVPREPVYIGSDQVVQPQSRHDERHARDTRPRAAAVASHQERYVPPCTRTNTTGAIRPFGRTVTERTGSVEFTPGATHN